MHNINRIDEIHRIKKLSDQKCSSLVPSGISCAKCAINIIKQVSHTHRAEWKKLYDQKNTIVIASLKRKVQCYKIGNPLGIAM